MKPISYLSAIVLAFSLQACSSLSTSSTQAVEQLVIAEPLTVHYKSEIALARLSEVLTRADITDDQRAQLFYDRGVIYDSVGLRSLARLDFTRALRLKNDLVDAYNFLGIHLTQNQEFIQAYDQFDSAIELAPDHDYAYLNRGIALYYGGRAELAKEDLTTFHQQQVNDPYRILWLYLAERNVDPKTALANLKLRATQVDDDVWGKEIIRLYAEEISQSAFIDTLTVGVSSSRELADRLCEGYFYLAKYQQFSGNNNAAANYFKLALSTNVYEFVEHRYAKLELQLMRETLVNSPQS
ncbi:lipoprotein NlpI [Thalassotalea sp. LPB0316]|uniref:lipoprotein NlpI n=1 Tax=Thalassotalea sp. LPB0316 TaxID=2769490 RepID=UPI0018663CCD|nr:lipoprotein NlpI [Thalassotalea sp. LPB0316]QOL24324.1 lipoprotein NlpI [Thalassotalea sp. LPB0316]